MSAYFIHITGTITCSNVTGLTAPILTTDAVNKNYADTMAIPASRITGYPSPVDVVKVLRGDGTWDSVYNTIPDRSIFGIKLLNYQQQE